MALDSSRLLRRYDFKKFEKIQKTQLLVETVDHFGA